MKTPVILLSLFSLLACSGSASAQNNAQAGDRTWITNVFLVSPEDLDHIEKGSVLIENGYIARVERTQKAKAPAGAKVFDGKGQYLIPGLIDSHVHLANVPGMSYDQGQSMKEMSDAYFRQLPRSYLFFGYTTLVDLAVYRQDVIDEFRKAPLHPDLYDCGGSLPFANGYPMNFIPAAQRFQPFPNFIYDPKQADRIPAEYKPEDHTPAADVARVKSSGAICVKTYFERGFADDKNLPVMSPEVMAEIRKAATDAGLVLMIHANGFEAQQFGVDGKADVLAHGMWHWGNLDKEQQLPDEIRQLLDRIVKERIGYQPTIQVLAGEIAYFDPDYLKMETVSKVIPKELLGWFESPEGKWFGKEINDTNLSNEAIVSLYEKGPIRRVQQVVAYLASKDANFLFGTDTPSAPTYGNLPGLNGYLEMQQLQKAGMSLRQIFEAATIHNAREFKLQSQIGTIEPGKVANLVLTAKSPLDSVEAYDAIATIWVHGVQISRESLAAGRTQ
jgi:imidazolonepropionase-like amidohydrolase